ncbi:MAG: HD domain-containing protein [Clostridiales bacterium]|nr:HD domain-containing protein [Clostridiales bacterium]
MGNVILKQDFSEAILHGIYVSNMAYEIGKELGLDDDKLHELAIAGMLHDIGKMRLSQTTAGEENLVVKQLRYVRMHTQLGYEILKSQEYSDVILQSVLHHHENFDGSGYPDNLRGDSIPLEARILRICDVFIALISDRAYRKGFDINTAIRMMMDEASNYDMKIFLAFLNVINYIDIEKTIINREKNCINQEDILDGIK